MNAHNNIVSSFKKRLNESYNRWNQQGTAFIVSSNNNHDNVKLKKMKKKNQKQEKQKMKKKNKISDGTCAKNKTRSKNKKKEKFAASRTEKPISNENVTDISS